jgi:hypothetical protein
MKKGVQNIFSIHQKILLVFIFCSAIIYSTIAQSTLNLKLFIEGYYSGNGLMNNYGYGGCLYVNGFSSDPNDVDTVNVSLMDTTTLVLIESQTGILKTNGNITCTFSQRVIGNAYYIKINHRNALETWSSTPILMNSITTFDFTTALSKAYGNNMIEVHVGAFAFFSGDVNQDLSIDSIDIALIEISVYNTDIGYVATDITGDGIVESSDWGLEENNIYFQRRCLKPTTSNTIDLYLSKKDLSVFPNPANDNFHIAYYAMSLETENLIVYDYTGKIILKKIIQPIQIGINYLNIDLFGLEYGTYYIQMINSIGESRVRPVIKIQ